MSTATLNLDALWANYRRSGTDDARNAIAERHLDTVGRIAAKMIRRCPKTVDVEDLISWGTVGLMKAIRSFDPDRRVAFTTWASTRIRGEILDQIREHSPLSRLMARRVDQINNFRDRFLQDNDREPSDEETHLACGAKVIADADAARPTGSMEIALKENDLESLVPMVNLVEDHRELDPYTRAAVNDLIDFASRRLKLTEAIIIKSYFIDGMTIKAIGEEILNRSESRAFQLLNVAIEKLRAAA